MKRDSALLNIFFIIAVPAITLILLRNLSPAASFNYGFVQIFTSTLVILWLFLIEWRITDVRMVRIIYLTGMMFVLFSMLEVCKEHFFIGNIRMQTYIWYAYYIPLTLIPMLCLCVSVIMARPAGRKVSKRWFYLTIPTTLIILMFLTNNVHHLCLKFDPNSPDPSADCTYGIGFGIFLVWTIVMFVATFIIMIMKCAFSLRKRDILLPMLPVFFILIYVLLQYYAKLSLDIENIKSLELSDFYAMIVIGFFEGCISIGLIPANRNYRYLFSNSSVSSVIYDNDDDFICATDNAVAFDDKQRFTALTKPVLLDANTRLSSRPVTGGTCFWTDDLTEINNLDKQMSDILMKINTQNEILRAENVVIEERARIEARNRLYDKITVNIIKQADEILRITNNIENAKNISNKDLAKVALLNAYIKRRSNLEIIAFEDKNKAKNKSPRINMLELKLSLKESLRYLELSNVETFLSGFADGFVDASLVIATYEGFELILESLLKDISALAVSLSWSDGLVVLRLIITPLEGHLINLEKCDISSSNEDFKNISRRFTITTEDVDAVVKLMVSYDEEVPDNAI